MSLLHPTVRNGRALPSKKLTQANVEGWLQADEPVLLLRLQKTTPIPAAVRRYLDSEAGQKAREAFKCRTRDPWYAVPDVKTPDFFMTYMSGLEPGLVRNDTDCTCTNSVHSVRFTKPEKTAQVQQQWTSPFVQLSCELEGHPLGGGMLKLEPREAGQILIPESDRSLLDSGAILNEAVSIMRQWRHYAAH